MQTLRVLLTGIVFAIAAIAASNDQFVEERYRMKYGRYRDAVAYVGQACCRHMPHDTAVTVKPSANEAWFRAKFGRNTPAFEAGKKAVEVQVAAQVAECAELGLRPLTAVRKAAETEARLQMKYGRTFGAEERLKVMPAGTEERPLVAAAEHSPCTDACCKPGE